MRYRGVFPALDFLQTLPRAERAQCVARVRFFAETGKSLSDKHGHWLRPPYSRIYEFLAFVHGSNLYVVHGAPKRNRKAQENDYVTAQLRREDFLNGLTKSKTP